MIAQLTALQIMTDSLIEKAFEVHQSDASIDEKIQAYKLALEEFKTDKRLYINLGALLRSNGEAEEAAQLLQTGLVVLKSESPAILNNLGNALRDLNRYAEAASIYLRALKTNNEYFDADTSLLACYRDLGYHSLAKLQLKVMEYKYKESHKI